MHTKRLRRPQIGDEKSIKGVLHVRQQVMVDHFGARGYLVRDNKPVCEWVRKTACPQKPKP